ncbi:hypothetical protein [Yersinia sp. 2542 StPb PI]|uniref:hypothetical protein n=1 Tax=Yersinia sp. 2542 StPb PI TaxID=3117408 RepID=UPI003B27DBD8
MSETLALIKASIKPSAPDYIPPTPLSSRFNPLQNAIQSYLMPDGATTIETTRRKGEIIRLIVTKEHIDAASNKMVEVKTFDAATNTMNQAIEHFDLKSNMTNRVVESFSYDSVKKAVQLGETSVIEQSFDAKNNITRRAEQIFDAAGGTIYSVINPDPNVNSTNNLQSDICQLTDSINGFPTKESTPAPVGATMGNPLTLGPRNLVPVMNYSSRL